jgi:hypothetical protein
LDLPLEVEDDILGLRLFNFGSKPNAVYKSQSPGRKEPIFLQLQGKMLHFKIPESLTAHVNAQVEADESTVLA